jgi:hypothetical protein
MPLGRNCVTALPVAVVHRSGRQCTGPSGRCSNSRYLSTHWHHPHVRVGRPSWYVRYQCSTCVCDDQRSANLPTSRSTQKGTRQSIGGLQGHWPNRRLVGIGLESHDPAAQPHLGRKYPVSGCLWHYTSASAGCAGRGTGGGCGGVSGGGRGGTWDARGWHWERGRCSRRHIRMGLDGAQEDRKGDACCLGESDHTSLA